MGTDAPAIRVEAAPVPAALPAAVAALVVAASVMLLVQQAAVRASEAAASARLVAALGIVPARALRTAVVFPLRGRFVGYSLTPGCTAAFLLVPFLLLGAALIATRRVPILRGLKALAVVSAALFVANQARLLVIAVAMRGWGFRVGYERSHVFLGTIVSTIGVVGGVLLFLKVATRSRPRSASGG